MFNFLLLALLYYFSLLSPANSSSIAPQNFRDILFLPPQGHLTSSIDLVQSYEKIGLNIYDQNFENEIISSQYTKFGFLNSPLENYYWGIRVPYLLEKRKKQTYRQTPLKGNIEISNSKGLGNLQFDFIRRFPPSSCHEPFIDLYFSFSPYSGESKIASPQEWGNAKRGDSILEMEIRFGYSRFDTSSMGAFFLNYHFQGKRKRLVDKAEIKTAENSILGIRMMGQYFFNSNWDAILAGELSFDNGLRVSTPQDQFKSSKGLHSKISTSLTYQFPNRTISISLSSHYKHALYKINLVDKDSKVKKDQAELILGTDFYFP